MNLASGYRAVRAPFAPLRKRAGALRVRLAPNREFVRPGHFYSSVPDLHEVVGDRARIYDTDPLAVGGVDLRLPEQWELANLLAPMQSDMPFLDQPVDDLRYGFDNPSFGAGDGTFLHLMVRHLRPRRIVEVGSGFSSACTLDTVDRWLNDTTTCTFIDPEPALVRRLIGDKAANVELVERRVQDADPEIFASLRAGDLLFIDSSHVSKTGSDVNFLLFDVLPRLAVGVTIHLHDVFPAFEYPLAWVSEGRAWNECYLLRAFLQFNASFRIALWPSLLGLVDPARMADLYPGVGANPGGSIYVRRVTA